MKVYRLYKPEKLNLKNIVLAYFTFHNLRTSRFHSDGAILEMYIVNPSLEDLAYLELLGISYTEIKKASFMSAYSIVLEIYNDRRP